MLHNLTAPMFEHGALVEPVSTIVGLTLAVFGTLQSSLFTYTAVMGLGKGDGWMPPPKEWGKAWPFSISTGLEGPKPNASEPLGGAGGPFPDVHLFNDAGDYLGYPKDTNLYIGHNKGLAIDVYPNNVHKHEGQYATFAILAAKGEGRDPLCIVDFGLGYPNYYSGVYRQDANGSVPCFWLGGYGVQGMQVHLPSHTVGQTAFDINDEDKNKTLEAAHDFFCNHPAVLSLWRTLPPRHKVPSLLNTDRTERGRRTLNDTLKLHENKKLMKPGKRPSLPPRGSVPPEHGNTVTIAHELAGLSASVLCENGMSMGPDFVNIPEGKFCRMSDKTLWPTCDHRPQVGPTDDCFDVESKQLVVGGKVTRSEPYSKEMHYPLK
ncbi:hypothetical protein INS49_013276 [Diaporthe citri]|uniref:uncharacterized protein n=1 Tax=Diaporthe citri TaxID=83186 RepID=UPI001C7F883D|nr:uncharacterized protein INS49_013276 [Diaporthe citri]KAG6357399.1 hypothetical protein INS49_013276 [Diaporthe citri]